MWNGMDRRRFPRIEHPCKIRVKKKDSNEVIDAITENIGCGGICVLLDKDIGLFSAVEVEVNLEDGSEWIKCNGVVVWVVKRDETTDKLGGVFDTGIEFSDLAEEARQKIEKIVDKVLKDQKD